MAGSNRIIPSVVFGATVLLLSCGGYRPPAPSSSPFTFYTVIDSPVLPAGAAGSWDSHFTSDPWPVQVDGTWYMYYWGASTSPSQPPPCIGFATSEDLQSFSRSPSNPVLCPSSSAWDTKFTHKPAVIQAADGSFRMCYEGYNGTFKAVGLATASAITGPWARFNGGQTPVLAPSGPGEDMDIKSPVIFNDGNLYHLFYAAEDASAIWRIFHATSSDGLVWNKTGLVLDVANDPSQWDYGWVSADAVLNINGQFVMAYNAGSTRATAPLGEPSPSGCGLAYSTDLQHWTKYSGNPVLASSSARTPANEVWRCHLTNVGGQYRIYFNAGDDATGIEQIFLANANP